MGIEWWRAYQLIPDPVSGTLKIQHPAGSIIETSLVPMKSVTPNVVEVEIPLKEGELVPGSLPPFLSHLASEFDPKSANGLPGHTEFDFHLKLTVDLTKIASLIYPMTLKEEKCLDIWTKEMLKKGQIFQNSFPVCSPLVTVHMLDSFSGGANVD
ncbi:hypothetical protein DSO57_1015565 [Entomophthora muscae]|uniref:Uncharacterized protein n=1 Tax=Entomophthora muscae TaxID=34485 RepID=A0ACC2RWG1_9FUNG|nr:hypothetical protein DSO57_1015565 [Entomophthora muscae]